MQNLKDAKRLYNITLKLKINNKEDAHKEDALWLACMHKQD